MIKRFFWNIKNIIHWIPVLWNNFDWDSCFLFEIMSHKLYLMSEHFAKYGYHVGNDKDAKQMKICSTLCKRIGIEDYTVEQDEKKIQQQDIDLLCSIIKKQSSSWWT